MPCCAYSNAIFIKNGNYSLLSSLHVHHGIDFYDFIFLCVIIAAAGFLFLKVKMICETVEFQVSLYSVCVDSAYHSISSCVEFCVK
jgi:hypothetical protein